MTFTSNWGLLREIARYAKQQSFLSSKHHHSRAVLMLQPEVIFQSAKEPKIRVKSIVCASVKETVVPAVEGKVKATSQLQLSFTKLLGKLV
jgi:hypothetical protein